MTQDEALGMLDDIDNNGDGLTDWEAEFVDSLMKRGSDFTEKQLSTLQGIHEARIK